MNDYSRVTQEVERTIAEQSDSDAIASAASRHEELACEHHLGGRFADAVFQMEVAGMHYERLLDNEARTELEVIALHLAWAKTRMGRAASLRRLGKYSESASTFDEAANRLKPLSPSVLDLDEQHQELVVDWARTTGALLLNQGVLLVERKKPRAALDSWSKAEELLFDCYLQPIGPDADPKCAGKIVNLWENMLVTALKIGEGEQAARVVYQALKLFVWWPVQDGEYPPVMVHAFGSLMGCIVDLPPAQRKELNSHLPEPLLEMLDDFLEE